MNRSAGSQIASPEFRIRPDQAMLVTSLVSVWRSAPRRMKRLNAQRSEGGPGVPEPETPGFMTTGSVMVRPLGLEPRTL